MWVATARFLRANLPLVAIVVAMELALSFAETFGWHHAVGITSILLTGLVLHYAIRWELTGKGVGDAEEKPRFVGTTLRMVAICGVGFLLALLIGAALAFSAHAAWGSDSDPVPTTRLSAIILLVLLLPTSLALFGTLLPTYVLNHARGVRPAFDRGRRTFGFVFGWTLLGTGGVTAAARVVSLGIGTGLARLGTPTAFEFGAMFTQLGSIVATALAGIAPARAYLRSERSLHEIAQANAIKGLARPNGDVSALRRP